MQDFVTPLGWLVIYSTEASIGAKSSGRESVRFTPKNKHLERIISNPLADYKGCSMGVDFFVSQSRFDAYATEAT